MSDEAAIARLKEALGPKGWTQDPERLAPKLEDWRGRLHGETPILLLPGSTQEVSAAIAICAEARLAVTPQGGNTGLVGGATPQGEVLLSLERMRGVREVDAANDSLIVESGVTLSAVHDLAEEAGRFFPLSLGSQGTATIGGLMSTNAGGVAVLRYGMMRDLVLGIEAVLPDGRVWNRLRGLRKDNTGYDLKQLFIGAEGTLGVITAATLKLFARPAEKIVGAVGVADVASAVKVLEVVKRVSGDAVTAFELMPQCGVDLVLEHIPDTRAPFPDRHEWIALVEMSFSRSGEGQAVMEAALGEAIEAGAANDAVIAASEAQGEAIWKLRETLPEAEKLRGPSLKHDVSSTVSATPQLIEDCTAAARRVLPGAEILAFGHVGDGNIHFNVGPPEGMSREDALARQKDVAAAIYDVVVGLGGSISAEHGVGILKSQELADRRDGPELDMMRAIKHALDPNNIMNPRMIFTDHGAPGGHARAAE